MKKVLALLTIALCFAAGSAMAQGGGGQQMTPEQRAARMKERLAPANLTAAQMDSVIAITNDYGPKTREIFMDQAMSQEDKQAKMKTVNDERNKRIEKAIGAEAAKKVAEILAQRPGGGGGRPGGGK
jgi:hypothetical protein